MPSRNQDEQTVEPTTILASFCAATTFADLPDEVVTIAKRSILDTLGCAVGAHAYEPDKPALINTVVRSLGAASSDATVVCANLSAAAPFAALANGVICHGIDFDDLHGEALTHTSCVVLPAALATAEEACRSGKDLITSFVLGFEAAVRVGMAVMPSHYDHWHSTATNGTFGAAVAAGKNYGFSGDQFVHALGFSGTQAAGLLGFLKSGDDTKSFNPGKAAFNGVLAARMVKAGGTAPANLIEDARGYARAYSKAPDLTKLTRGLDGGAMVWEILNNMPKPFPSLSASHTAMDLTLRLVVENDLRPADIAGIVDRTYSTVKSHFSNDRPDNVMAARLSVPYCIAVCAARRHGGLDAFTMQTINDSVVRDMLKKVTIVADPTLDALYPEKFPSHIRITMTDGRVFEGAMDHAKGSPRNPLADEEINAKFRSLARPVLSAERVDEIVQMSAALDELRDVREFARLFA